MVWIGGPRRDPGDRLGRGRRGLYLHDPPPAIIRPPRMSLKDRQRKARQDWVLEHILAVILIPLAVAVAVIIVLMIVGYR